LPTSEYDRDNTGRRPNIRLSDGRNLAVGSTRLSQLFPRRQRPKMVRLTY
jgi:hypothetical protein